MATDDARIRDAAQAFGADVFMTSETCRNGTERCAEALANAALNADLIVNLQGDAPLTPPWFVEDLIVAMKQDADAQMATPVLRLDPLTRLINYGALFVALDIVFVLKCYNKRLLGKLMLVTNFFIATQARWFILDRVEYQIRF